MKDELLKKYKDYKEKLSYYNYASFIINFDSGTDCPKLDKERSNEVENYFNTLSYEIVSSYEYIDTIYKLFEYKDELDEVLKLDLELEIKNLDKIKKIPKDEYLKHMEDTSKSYLEWERARDTLDYSKFLIELDKQVTFNKKLMKWLETDSIKGFDVLLDEMEEGYTEKMYDEFFDVIETELVPYAKKILAKPIKYNSKLDNLNFDISKQKVLTERILETIGYTKDNGCIRETVHPFTNWVNHNDVRITTSYDESLLFSNIYSVIHEIGHAMFQIQMDPKYDDTNIFYNVSCITHESQSRFYENYLGKSKGFIKYLYPIIKDMFKEELDGITETDIYNYVNSVKAQYYRTEADELTYSIHVLIRYKIEKALFNGSITIYDIDPMFNSLMKEYLGIVPSNMKEGCFQDMHWTSMYGYFPTYAVGSAYGAMFLEEIKKSIDIDKELSEGNFKNINNWLKENIHKYSGTRNNNKVIEEVCHKPFDPHIYIDYLKKKFDEIYK